MAASGTVGKAGIHILETSSNHFNSYPSIVEQLAQKYPQIPVQVVQSFVSKFEGNSVLAEQAILSSAKNDRIVHYTTAVTSNSSMSDMEDTVNLRPARRESAPLRSSPGFDAKESNNSHSQGSYRHSVSAMEPSRNDESLAAVKQRSSTVPRTRGSAAVLIDHGVIKPSAAREIVSVSHSGSHVIENGLPCDLPASHSRQRRPALSETGHFISQKSCDDEYLSGSASKHGSYSRPDTPNNGSDSQAHAKLKKSSLPNYLLTHRRVRSGDAGIWGSMSFDQGMENVAEDADMSGHVVHESQSLSSTTPEADHRLPASGVYSGLGPFYQNSIQLPMMRTPIGIRPSISGGQVPLQHAYLPNYYSNLTYRPHGHQLSSIPQTHNYSEHSSIHPNSSGPANVQSPPQRRRGEVSTGPFSVGSSQGASGSFSNSDPNLSFNSSGGSPVFSPQMTPVEQQQVLQQYLQQQQRQQQQEMHFVMMKHAHIMHQENALKKIESEVLSLTTSLQRVYEVVRKKEDDLEASLNVESNPTDKDILHLNEEIAALNRELLDMFSEVDELCVDLTDVPPQAPCWHPQGALPERMPPPPLPHVFPANTRSFVPETPAVRPAHPHDIILRGAGSSSRYPHHRTYGSPEQRLRFERPTNANPRFPAPPGVVVTMQPPPSYVEEGTVPPHYSLVRFPAEPPPPYSESVSVPASNPASDLTTSASGGSDSPAEISEKWSCPRCTFCNLAISECELCNTPRPFVLQRR